MSNTKTKLARRDFLSLGAVGLAAGALSSGCAAPTTGKQPATPAARAGDIPAAKAAGPGRRILGRTGIELPIVSMGVMNADNPNLVRAALDGGILMLDTAHVYQEGRNEEMLGTVLKGRPRDSFVLCTKIAVSTMDRKTGLFSAQTRPEEIDEKLAISLKRLGLDHVDVLYLHNQQARAGVLFEPVLRAMEKVKKAGAARFIGVSTHKNEPEVMRAAIASKIYDVVLTSYNFRQDHHLEVEKAIGEVAAAGLGVVAMKTQAGIYWDKEKKTPINMKAALRWALRNPNVHTAIPGFTTLDQLQTDLEVLKDPVFTDDDGKSLNAPKVAGFFCQGCDECLDPCPEHLPIPELMRSYMYSRAYRNHQAAQQLLGELDLPPNPCDDCESCTVRCAQGFDVRERVREIVQLRHLPRDFFA